MARQIKDTELQQIIDCPHYYNVDTSAVKIDEPLIYLASLALDNFYTNALKNNLTNIDDAVFTSAARATYKFSKQVQIQNADLSVYTTYLINLLNAFIKEYPLNKYTPITGGITFATGVSYLSIEVSFAALFKAKNSNALTGIAFFKNQDTFSNSYFDLIKFLKLKSLNEIATATLGSNAKIPANLHCFYLKPDTLIHHNHVPYVEKHIWDSTSLQSIDYYSKALSYIDKNYLTNTFPKPNCSNKKCPKRKACFNAR